MGRRTTTRKIENFRFNHHEFNSNCQKLYTGDPFHKVRIGDCSGWKCLRVSVASGFCAPGSKDILTLPNATAVPLEKAKSIYNKPSANSTACIFNLRAVTQVWLGRIFRTTAEKPSTWAACTSVYLNLNKTWATAARCARSRTARPLQARLPAASEGRAAVTKRTATAVRVVIPALTVGLT